MKQTKKITMSLITSVLLTTSTLLANDINRLDAITVTAQKQEQNLQEVPISISVFNDVAIADKKIEMVKDIAQYTPNLMFFNYGDMGVVSPTIRGLSSDPTSFSSSVSLYIDGVPTFSSVAFDNVALGGVERIEVLKGPQGTLYGKNAEAGVINIITKQPTNETKGALGLEFGEDNKQQYSFNGSGAIINDKLYIGVNGRFFKKDGFVQNTNLNTRDNDRENTFGKLYLRYTLSDELDISLISSYFKRNDDSASMTSTASGQDRKVSSNIQGSIDLKTIANVVKAEYNTGDYKFESITAHKIDDDVKTGDFDYSPKVFHHRFMDMTYKNLSQEFRLSSQFENFSWLAGVYADKSEADGGWRVESMNPMMAGATTNKQDDDSQSIFAYGKYKLNEQTALSLGLRYDKDNKEIHQIDKRGTIDVDFSSSAVSPKISLEHKINKDIMTYATIAKGYKSGGFYIFAPPGYSKQYDKETLINYEIGMKSSLLNNRLVLNGAIYYMDIKDMQVLTSTTPSNGYMSNAAKSTSQGFEFDLNYQATDTLSLSSSFGYTDITFDEFSDFLGDHSGNTNPFAPKYNYALGMQYRDIGGYFARVDLTGYGKMYIDKENKYERSAYALVNTKIGYEREDYDIYLYGKNIFDKEYDIVGYYNGQITIPSDPREIGVQLAYRF